jgi:hypothetical protein
MLLQKEPSSSSSIMADNNPQLLRNLFIETYMHSHDSTIRRAISFLEAVDTRLEEIVSISISISSSISSSSSSSSSSFVRFWKQLLVVKCVYIDEAQDISEPQYGLVRSYATLATKTQRQLQAQTEKEE